MGVVAPGKRKLVGKGFLCNFKSSFKVESEYLFTDLLEYFSWTS